MPETLPATLRETVKLLFQNGLKLSEISAETGVKQQTIRTWANRYSWNIAATNVKTILENRRHKALARQVVLVQSPARMPNGVNSKLREELSSELATQVAVLKENPVKTILELRNTPDREGRASVVKRIAETAALVEDWEAQRAPGVVAIGLMAGPPDEIAQEQAVIDVQAEASDPDPAEAALRALQED